MNNNHAIILFDGVCNLCNASVQLIIKRDKSDYFRFASLQSTIGQKYVTQFKLKQDSIVLIEGDIAYIESTAALRIARHLSGLYPMLIAFFVLPRFIRDFVYKIISRNRYKWFGRQHDCWLPNPELKKKFL